MARPRAINWDAEPLGRESDAEIARRLACSQSSVAMARARRCIPAAGRPEPPTAGIDWDAQPLGQVRDAALARALGIPVHYVAAAREARGLPAICRGRIRVDWAHQPLGQLPDYALAQQLGTYAAAVAFQRRQRGIPAFGTEPAAMPPAPDAAREAAWAASPPTPDLCRVCAETPRRRGAPRRWTDQGPCCWAHYAALPPCAACGAAPVANAGEWCEACCGRYQRAVGEAGGWRSGEGPAAPAPIGLGTAAALAHGLARFEERNGKALVMR